MLEHGDERFFVGTIPAAHTLSSVFVVGGPADDTHILWVACK
jgi:hypothetical protein